MVQNPVMFVAVVGAVVDHRQALLHPVTRRVLRLLPADRPLALVHGVVRQLCRGHGRRPGQGPGGALCARPGPRPWPTASAPTARLENGSGGVAAQRRYLRGVRPGRSIPADGEVIEGAATVDESAITGESAPVIREAGGDRSAVTGGTRVLSDEIVVRVTANPGESFMDRMIGLIEGRQPPEDPQRNRPDHPAGGPDHHLSGGHRDLEALRVLFRACPSPSPVLAALLVCLIPTTIGGLLSAPSASPASTGWCRKTSWP